MKTILIGAVGSTRVVLQAMQAAGHAPSLLVTFIPEVGRKRHADYEDLSLLAGPETEILFVDNINEPDNLERIRRVEADAMFVVGWSQIARRELRNAARQWCIGFHPTLLPKMRGRGVMGWTIALGLREAGATLFTMDDGIDTGDILAQARFALDERETLSSLGNKLLDSLDTMIRELLPKLANGRARAVPQPLTGASYCARRTAADQLIDWTRPVAEVDRLIRASGRPYAGAFTFTRKRRVTVWSAEPATLAEPHHAFDGQIVLYRNGNPIVRCGDGGFLEITEYEPDGVAEPLTGQVRLRSRPDEAWEKS